MIAPTAETLADGVLRTETSHFPVVILRWRGDPTVAAVEACREWLDRMISRAASTSTKLYLINDTSDSGRPSPTIRRELSALIHHLAKHPDRAHLLGGAVIVPGAILRATFSMVIALARIDLGFRPVKSMDQALERALRVLADAGVEVPASLERLARGDSTG